MPAHKGTRPPNAGRGRVKGVPNKINGDARAVFTQFLERNAPRAQELWEKVAAKNPDRALELLAKLGEFVLPKLARTEVSGQLAVTGKLVIEG